MAKRYRIGVVGFGRMGRGFTAALMANPVWEVAAVCDTDPAARAAARTLLPQARVTPDAASLFKDKSIPVVGLFTLADHRAGLLKKALAAGKHILAEKPLAVTVEEEWELVRAIERSDRLVAVNLFNRNAWYHKEIQQHIGEGEIGELAIIRVCHMTPGHMAGEGHEPEGPPFHDCGMHYVDVARWYARSEYATWHAQGVRMWSYRDPWWVQVHGTFKNGVVFDVTQGFVYGQLAKDKTHNCYVDCIGTQGIARMRHDFHLATVEVHGVRNTVTRTAPFNDKKLDVMVDLFARSLIAGKNLGFPTARDAVIASEVSWAMLHDAVRNGAPAVGTAAEREEILQHRRGLQQGYGLPIRRDLEAVQRMGRLEEARACGEASAHGEGADAGRRDACA